MNKTETKVELLLDIKSSNGFDPEEKDVLLKKLATSVSDDSILSISSQKFRSQFANKEDVIEKLKKKLEKALTPVAKRIKTKPTQASIEDRLQEKKKIAEKKEIRRKPEV